MPIAWIYALGLAVRDRLFQLNIWKSVEFEIPVIKVGGLSTLDSELSTKVSRWILSQLSDAGMQAIMLRHIKYLKPTAESQFEYLRSTGEEAVLDATHRVMGVSEVAYQFEETQAVILNNAFRTKDIRCSFDVLLIEAEKPFFNDWLMPVGSLRSWRGDARNANVVFVFGLTDQLDLEQLKSSMSREASIYFANDLGTEIEVLQDGDKFAAEFKQFVDQSKEESQL